LPFAAARAMPLPLPPTPPPPLLLPELLVVASSHFPAVTSVVAVVAVGFAAEPSPPAAPAAIVQGNTTKSAVVADRKCPKATPSEGSLHHGPVVR
jgi:hypothetical protein